VSGEYDHTPVIRRDCVSEDTIVIADFERIAALVQLAPDDRKQFPLAMSVTEITAEEAEEQLNRKAQQNKLTGAQGVVDRQLALRRIRQYVKVNIAERCQFEDVDYQAGRRIVFTRPSEPELPPFVTEPIIEGWSSQD
jgi:hypothetical protein